MSKLRKNTKIVTVPNNLAIHLFLSFVMRILVVPILKNRWAYYCHSTLPTTSRLTKVVDWTVSKWDNFGEADPSSWKGKLYKNGNNFMDRMDYQEWFLKGVPIKEDLESELTKVNDVWKDSMVFSVFETGN
jgi:hypothetical protein